MKKKISLLLALTMLLTGCNTAEKAEQKAAETTTTTTAETTVVTTATTAMTTTAKVTTTATVETEELVKAESFDLNFRLEDFTMDLSVFEKYFYGSWNEQSEYPLRRTFTYNEDSFVEGRYYCLGFYEDETGGYMLTMNGGVYELYFVLADSPDTMYTRIDFNFYYKDIGYCDIYKADENNSELSRELTAGMLDSMGALKLKADYGFDIKSFNSFTDACGTEWRKYDITCTAEDDGGTHYTLETKPTLDEICFSQRYYYVEVPEIIRSLTVCVENKSGEWKINNNTFISFLTYYTERYEYPPHGVLIEDINGDGQDEMVVEINPYGYLYVLYIKDGELKVLECDTMSEWGGTWYDKANNRIVNQYFYGHTEGSMGAYEYYVYDWNGEDYVMTMHLECEAGYFEREADGVTRTDNFIDGQAYLNGEEISSEEFEKLHTELTQVMTAENLFDVVTSGYFEIHKEAAEEQREIYNAYLAEKLYTPQMTYYEIEHHHRQDADSLPPKPQGINIAKLNYDDSSAVKTLDKDIENIAIECLRSSESYSKTAEALKKSKGKYYIGEVELTAHTDENYAPLINITQSYSMDFDGNGKDEHFVILRYLDIEPEFIPYETDCCVFVSDSGNAELIIPKSIDMRMGIIQGDGLKHIIFEGGCNNTTSFFSIYSVKEGKPCKELDEWNGQSIKDGEIILNTQLCRYCAAYDIEKQEYVFYSFYE